MSDVQYVRGVPADRSDIVDFANYVFSHDHEPHDFKQLLPKVYADDVQGMEDWHFLAKADGRIRAMVCRLPLTMHVGDRVLRCGFIGTVSVHPYARGAGYMKHVMADVLEDARGRFDVLVLGGQRQRYNYFGFERAGAHMHYTLNPAGMRHCLRNVDVSDITFSDLTEERPEEIDFVLNLMKRQVMYCERPRAYFLHYARSWCSRARLVRIAGEMAGYVIGEVSEMGLADEKELPRVLKALIEQEKLAQVDFYVAPFERERMMLLRNISEIGMIVPFEMIRVLNWPRFVETMLRLKATAAPLEDGVCTVCVTGESTFTVRVEGGVPTVTEDGREPDVTCTHLEAERMFMSLDNLLWPGTLPATWAPLPFKMTGVDTF